MYITASGYTGNDKDGKRQDDNDTAIILNSICQNTAVQVLQFPAFYGFFFLLKSKINLINFPRKEFR